MQRVIAKPGSTSAVRRYWLRLWISGGNCNAFSKKLENHMHALSLYFMFYNYCKTHKSLKITPAMAAGLTDHVWELADIVNLIPEPEPKKRGAYKKKALQISNDLN
jgi:hypothetical protein